MNHRTINRHGPLHLYVTKRDGRAIFFGRCFYVKNVAKPMERTRVNRKLYRAARFVTLQGNNIRAWDRQLHLDIILSSSHPSSRNDRPDQNVHS